MLCCLALMMGFTSAKLVDISSCSLFVPSFAKRVSILIARHVAVGGNPLQGHGMASATDRSLWSVSLFDRRACRMDKASIRRIPL